jgi:nucleoid DNA-binding protein
MAKKTAAKKTPKKAAAPKAAPAAKPAKIAPAGKVRSKSETYAVIAENVGLTKKQIASVFDTLGALIKADLSKDPKVFTIPGLAKITVQHKPATKARKGINPFTKEEQTFKAKPARNVVKLRAVKALKDLA